MDLTTMKSLLTIGEHVAVEFKRCGNGIEHDEEFCQCYKQSCCFSPTIYLAPEIIKDEEGHVVIHVHVPPSAEVHSYKKIIYDRVDDADVKVTSTSQIASMYIRKQNIFTEKKIFPYVTMEDLRLDLLPRIRRMAVNHAGGSHPWENMDDEDLLKAPVYMEWIGLQVRKAIIWLQLCCSEKI